MMAGQNHCSNKYHLDLKIKKTRRVMKER